MDRCSDSQSSASIVGIILFLNHFWGHYMAPAKCLRIQDPGGNVRIIGAMIQIQYSSTTKKAYCLG